MRISAPCYVSCLKTSQMDIVILGGTSGITGYMKAAGIYRVATELRNAGFSVQTLDKFIFCTDVFLKEFLSSVVTESTLCIGISTTMLQTSSATYSHNTVDYQYFGFEDERFKKLVTFARSLNPKIKIVIGGPQVSLGCAPIIQRFAGFIDFCVTGQGDTAIVALANHLKFGDDLDYREIDCFKFVDDVAYPVTNYDALAIEYVDSDCVFEGEATTIEVARGCVFKCKFCTYDLIGKSWGDMIKSKKSLIAEMERNYAEHGITTYICSDDTLNDSLEKVQFIHDIFTNLSFQPIFSGYFRLDVLGKFRQQARLLKESGIWSMNFGIETMDKKAGALMGKGLGADRIKEILNYLREEFNDEVILTGNFIIGLPGESVESMYSTLAYMLEPDCPLHSGNFRPLTLSRHIKGFNADLFKQAEKYGYVIDDDTDAWTSPILDSGKANEITKDILATLIAKKNPNYKLVHTFHIMKLLNIGYSKAQIIDMVRNEPRVDFSKQEIRKRTHLTHQNYYSDVLDWVKLNKMKPQMARHSSVIMPFTNGNASITPIVWQG